MTLKPFKAGNFEDDPDAAFAKLENWLAKAVPLFLDSPEYKKLSKANRKSEGSWFELFMETFVGYIGTELRQLDEQDAAEILLDLFPRKVICPDSQAKMIIPELIAFWQFLDRELNSGKRRQLQYAGEVIRFLKSIKRDYLPIFKCEVEAYPKDDGLVMGEMMTQSPSGEGYLWVNALIAEAARDLEQLEKSPSPPDDWAVLYNMGALSQFLEQVLTIGVVPEPGISEPEISEAVENLLSFACHNLFKNIRQKDRDALAFWADCENNIMAAAEHGDLIVGPMETIISILLQYRQYLSESFMHFIRNWEQAKFTESGGSSKDFSMDDLNDVFLRVLDEVPDEFAFTIIARDQLGVMPADALKVLILQVLKLGSRVADALALMVLDPQELQAESVASAIGQHPETISAKTLYRLICIRNWLSPRVQKTVDKLIRDVRKLGVSPEAPGEFTEESIHEMRMSPVDASGAQGVMVMVKEKRAFRLISFVLKESVGVVDVSVSPPKTKTHLKQFLALARKQMGKMEKVTLDLIQEQLPVFLALNLRNKIAIDPELVQAMELLGVRDWNPVLTSESA